MSDRPRRESPLARFDLAARAGLAGVVASATQNVTDACTTIGERAFLGHLNLRGAPRDAKFVAAVREVVGVAPPDAPNTVVEALGHVVCWLGPDEWLIVTPAGHEAEIARSLRTSLRDVRSAVTDVTGGQTVIAIRGAAARDVLAKGCPLDVHPREFGAGRCAQSHLAKAAILLRIVDTTPTFEIVVRRSYADYLWQWLNDAAAEYGVEMMA